MIDVYDKQQYNRCNNYNRSYFHNSFPHGTPPIGTKIRRSDYDAGAVSKQSFEK